MIKALSDTFEKASRIKTNEERIKFIRENASESMRFLVQCAYHPEVIWLLPRGIPPFRKPIEPLDLERALHNKVKEIKIFLKGGGYDGLDQEVRKDRFIAFLECLEPRDAILLCYIKDKNINYPNLTYSFFKEAFPNWLPDRNEKTWVKETTE